MRAVSSGSVSVEPPSPAVAVAMRIRWPFAASSASVPGAQGLDVVGMGVDGEDGRHGSARCDKSSLILR